MKIKLRDMTAEQWDKWYHEDCYHTDCEKCPITGCGCDTSGSKFSWVNNKEMFSDKFLDQELEIEGILTDEEKEYLENVIKPFRDRVSYIQKGKNVFAKKEYIVFSIKDESYMLYFPSFEKNKYYKNLEIGKEYTFKDLGLFENEQNDI